MATQDDAMLYAVRAAEVAASPTLLNLPWRSSTPDRVIIPLWASPLSAGGVMPLRPCDEPLLRARGVDPQALRGLAERLLAVQKQLALPPSQMCAARVCCLCGGAFVLKQRVAATNREWGAEMVTLNDALCSPTGGTRLTLVKETARVEDFDEGHPAAYYWLAVHDVGAPPPDEDREAFDLGRPNPAHVQDLGPDGTWKKRKVKKKKIFGPKTRMGRGNSFKARSGAKRTAPSPNAMAR